MERISFTMLVAPEHMDTYVRMHAATWPELLHELDRLGWQNYSLFLRDDGMLVGYHETTDWAESQRAMSATDVSARWSVEMDRLVVPGTSMRYPVHTLHLESTLGVPTVRAPYRHCAVLDELPTLSEHDLASLRTAGMHNVSFFVRDDGLVVAYGETDAPGIPPWPWHDPQHPLREVFNLDEQLGQLP